MPLTNCICQKVNSSSKSHFDFHFPLSFPLFFHSTFTESCEIRFKRNLPEKQFIVSNVCRYLARNFITFRKFTYHLIQDGESRQHREYLARQFYRSSPKRTSGLPLNSGIACFEKLERKSKELIPSIPQKSRVIISSNVYR